MEDLRKKELDKLGRNVRRLRKSRGMNQTMLAQAARTRPTTISAIENGINANPGWDLLGRVAEVLDSTIHALTQPEIVIEKMPQKGSLPEGLGHLMHRQSELLALSEPRISLKELEWLSHTPKPENREISCEEYLMILRYFRLVIQ
ncbi:helix-turn-helix transcriptional regulator [bacterium]|nr:helix-turn-helix transcriptional regulator [candidate division CSSED10-310 bacterium]